MKSMISFRFLCSNINCGCSVEAFIDVHVSIIMSSLSLGHRGYILEMMSLP